MIYFLLFVLWQQAMSQLAGTEMTMRSMTSVDVQVCVDDILSSERQDLQNVVHKRLQTILQSSGVYLAREFTREAGAICFLYVYQGISPEAARAAVPLVMGKNGEMNVDYTGGPVLCRVEAVPWVGEDVGPLGVGWELSGSDMLLWGGCGGGILTACVLGVCCCLRLSWKREKKRMDELLEQVRRKEEKKKGGK